MISRHLPSVALPLLMALAACSNDLEVERPQEYVTEKRQKDAIKYGTIGGGNGGFVLFDSKANKTTTEAAFSSTANANPFLWRAALETIDFMPLIQTDPVGGVILTDWYSPPSTSTERFKLNVFVLGSELRADGVRVTAFRQVRSETGQWVDAKVREGTASEVEDSILAKARELRVASLEAAEAG